LRLLLRHVVAHRRPDSKPIEGRHRRLDTATSGNRSQRPNGSSHTVPVETEVIGPRRQNLEGIRSRGQSRLNRTIQGNEVTRLLDNRINLGTEFQVATQRRNVLVSGEVARLIGLVT
jgi:hypothetical protein